MEKIEQIDVVMDGIYQARYNRQLHKVQVVKVFGDKSGWQVKDLSNDKITTLMRKDVTFYEA